MVGHVGGGSQLGVVGDAVAQRPGRATAEQRLETGIGEREPQTALEARLDVAHLTQFLPAFWSSIALRLNLDGCASQSDGTLNAIDLDRSHLTLESDESYPLARPLTDREGLRRTAVHQQNRTIAEHTCQFDLGGKHACG